MSSCAKTCAICCLVRSMCAEMTRTSCSRTQYWKRTGYVSQTRWLVQYPDCLADTADQRARTAELANRCWGTLTVCCSDRLASTSEADETNGQRCPADGVTLTSRPLAALKEDQLCKRNLDSDNGPTLYDDAMDGSIHNPLDCGPKKRESGQQMSQSCPHAPPDRVRGESCVIEQHIDRLLKRVESACDGTDYAYCTWLDERLDDDTQEDTGCRCRTTNWPGKRLWQSFSINVLGSGEGSVPNLLR